MGSSPRSYLLTSAPIRIPVHTATKNGRNLPDIRSRSTFKIGAAQIISVAEIPVKSPILCVNRKAPYPVHPFSCQQLNCPISCEKSLNEHCSIRC